MFKKLRMWFWTKSRMINEIIKMSEMLDVHSKKMLSKIEELDQEKVYVCKIPGVSDDQMMYAKQALKEIAKLIKWTMPRIIFINAEIVEKK